MTNAEIGPGEFYPVVGVGPHPKPWPIEEHFDKELLENVLPKYLFSNELLTFNDNRKKYLEIGVSNGSTFYNVQCETKHGVDPNNKDVTHPTTSDKFFENCNDIYDIIFIFLTIYIITLHYFN